MKSLFVLLIPCFMTLSAFGAAENFRSISVNGSCFKKIMPDRGSITLVAQADEKTAAQAAKKATEIYEQIRKSVVALKLKNLEMQTSEYVINELCDYQQNGKKVCKGFRSSLGLQVVTSEINRLGEVMALSSKLEINRVEGLQTFLSQEKTKESQEACLVEAIQNARDKAEKMAGAGGTKVGEILLIDENPNRGENGPIPAVMSFGSAKMSMDRSGTVSAGVESRPESIAVTVLVRFQLR